MSHVAQPSLSQQILKLEEELGGPLFLPHETRGAADRRTARRFFVGRSKILEEVDAAKREASDAQSLLRGQFSVGVLPTIAPYLLPDVLVAFAKKYPGVEIVVQEDTTARLIKLVQTYEIDFALTSCPVPETSMEVRDLLKPRNCAWPCRRVIR